MGVAAYNRGSAIVRRQADADVEQSREAVDNRHTREAIKELRKQLSQEQVSLRRARRLIELLRAEKRVLQAEVRYRDGQLNEVLGAMKAAGGTGVARIMAAMTTIKRLIEKDSTQASDLTPAP